MSEEIRALGTESTDPPTEPLTREEQYLSAIADVTSSSEIPEKPRTRVEKYLNKIVENGGGGGSVYESLEAGVNITIEETSDGKAKISASGEVSSEDAVARAEIAEMKDGTTIDSFGDVEAALATKANSADVYSKSDIDTAMSEKADKSTTYTKTEVDTALGNKVDKVSGKGLSTNDFTTAEKTKLDDLAEIKSIGTGLNLDSTTGELTATGGGGGTVNNAAITIQKNGTTVESFTVNQATDETINITVPTQASDINAATAAQGSKADSAIQGITVNSTTVTPDSNKIVNITVPTSAADVSAIPTTEKGASFGVATLDSSGKLTSSQLPSISEVPTVGSSDNDKVLTAVYSGGSGSYEWATADNRVYYCTCSTGASTAKKVVTTTQDFKLTTGCIIAVKFNNANTASSVQLNVNNTGDKTIAYAASNPYTGTDKVVTGYGASHINYYIYNGTNWRWGGCTAPRVPDASSATPQPLGTAAAGSSTDYSRADHVHAMPANATTSAAGLMSADDKKELIELVDNGAKNELLLTLDEFKSQNTSGTWSGNAYTLNGITFTVNDDMTVTVNGTLTGERALFRLFFDRPNIWGGKFLTGCPSGGSVYDYGINLEQSASPWSSIAQDYGNGNIISDNTSANLFGYIAIMKSVSNLTFKPMICSKAAWDITQNYAPYAPTNAELYEMIKALQP